MNGRVPPQTPTPAGTPGRRRWFLHPAVAGLTLALAVALVYGPMWRAGYIWDDDLLITRNPCVVGPLGLREIWTTAEADICPLTISAFVAGYRLWGASPLPYHLATVGLHAACAVLLWRVLRGLDVPGAWLGAALWALHPVQVESVAWITETKNTLSGVFYLLSILSFLRWRRGAEEPGAAKRVWPYVLTLLWAVLAMTAKTSAVVLPVVLGLLAWWQDGQRWRGRSLRVVVPVALMSVAATIFSVWTLAAQSATGAGSSPVRGLGQRLAGAGDAVWFYLGKLAWPWPLMTIYPRWDIDPWRWYAFLPGVAVALALAVLWRGRQTWAAAGLVCFTYFLVALSPVLGVVEMGFSRHSLVADHFLYLASMGPLALAGAILARRWRPVLGAAVLITLGWASWQRTWVYRDQSTLWADELTRNPRCWAGYEQLGFTAMEAGRVEEANQRFQQTLDLNPGDITARGDLANGLLQTGHADESIAEYRTALRLDANHAFLHTNLGVALTRKGQVDEAISHYQEALKIDSGYADAHDDLGCAWLQKRQWEQAADEFRTTLKIEPRHANVHNNLVLALALGGHVDEALAEQREAVKFDRPNADVVGALANLLLQNGRVDEATTQFQEAVKFDPDSMSARTNLGVMFLQKDRVVEAIIQFQEAVKLDPDNAIAHDNLGLGLARNGRLADAAGQFQQAMSLQENFKQAQDHLAVVQAAIDQQNGAH